MGCTIGTVKDDPITTVGKPATTAERRVSASKAESTGEAEKASSATTLSSQLADTLTIVHFNDVYNIEEREKEPCGGAPRFKTQLDSLNELDPLVFFSGDALNPSNSKCHLARGNVGHLLRPITRGRNFIICTVLYVPIAVSIVMQGKQMVPVLNSMEINAAVYGNHDFGESSKKIINWEGLGVNSTSTLIIVRTFYSFALLNARGVICGMSRLTWLVEVY